MWRSICNARNYVTPLLPLVQGGKLKPSRIITHTMALGEAPKGYAIFDRKERNRGDAATLS